jgi:ABC-2 type transport system ATP-binding protein
MSEAVVEATGLRKRYGETLAVADLSLSVRRGEVFGFLGPNGAGKTTSLKMLLGLVRPTGGRGKVLGARLGERRARARLGFLPEHFRFQDWLTGRELLHFHGRLFGIPRRDLESRAERLLARLDLLDAAGRRIGTYSKGMLQRAGLAQALINEPELVFLDEPTSGLDPLGRLLVRDVVKELREAGTAVFINSHLLGEVEATCDRVAFIKQGRTVHEMALAAAPDEVAVEVSLGSADAETLAALAALGQGANALERLPHGDGGSSGVNDARGDTVGSGLRGTMCRERFRLRVPDEDVLPAVARTLVERGVPLYEMRLVRKSLEARFLEVMGDDQRPG